MVLQSHRSSHKVLVTYLHDTPYIRLISLLFAVYPVPPAFPTRLRLCDGVREKREALKVVRSISFRFRSRLCPLRLSFASSTRLSFPSVSAAQNNLGGSRVLAGVLIKLASFNYSAIDSRAI